MSRVCGETDSDGDKAQESEKLHDVSSACAIKSSNPYLWLQYPILEYPDLVDSLSRFPIFIQPAV